MEGSSYMATKKSFNWQELLTAVLYILVGILFIAFKHEFLNWILTITGVLFIVLGIAVSALGNMEAA